MNILNVKFVLDMIITLNLVKSFELASIIDLCGLEPLMKNFQGIADNVILLRQSSETGQNLIINLILFCDQDFLEWIENLLDVQVLEFVVVLFSAHLYWRSRVGSDLDDSLKGSIGTFVGSCFSSWFQLAAGLVQGLVLRLKNGVICCTLWDIMHSVLLNSVSIPHECGRIPLD